MKNNRVMQILQKYQNMRFLQVLFIQDRFFSAVGISIIGSVLTRVGSFVRNILFARWLGPSDFGLFSLALVIQSFILPFLMVGAGGNLVRSINRYPKKQNQLIKSIYPAPIFISLTVSITLFIFPKFPSKWIFGTPSHEKLIIFVAILLPVFVFYILGNYALQGKQYFRAKAAGDVIYSWLFLCLGSIFIPTFRGVQSALLASLISYIIAGLFVNFFVFFEKPKSEKSETQIQFSLKKELVYFQRWFFLAEVSFATLNWGLINRWFLNYYLSESATGLFFASLTFGGLLTSDVVLLNSVLFPKLVQQISSRSIEVNRNYNKIVRILLTLHILAAIIMLLFKDQVISILLGKEYLEIEGFLNLILISYAYYIFIYLNNAYLLAIGKAKDSFVAFFLGSIINLVLNPILIPRFGIPGSIIALGSGFGVVALSLSFFNHKNGLPMYSNIWLYVLPLLLLVRNPLILYIILFGLLIIVGRNGLEVIKLIKSAKK